MKSAIVTGYFVAMMFLVTASAGEPVSSASVPIEIINGFPVLSVSIGDQQIPVAFDLGGDNQIELTTTALRKIQVKPLAKTYTWLDAKGHRLEARMFLIPELRIGSFVFRDVEGHEDAEAADWPKTRSGLGRMGRAFLTPYKIVLDYAAKTMSIVDNAPRDSSNGLCSGHRVVFDSKWNGEPVTQVLTDIGPLTLFWDTGAPGTFIQAKLMAKGESLPSVGPVLSQKFAMEGQDFGPLELRPIEFSQPEGADGFLGYNFFARHVVCVDFPGKAIFIR